MTYDLWWNVHALLNKFFIFNATFIAAAAPLKTFSISDPMCFFFCGCIRHNEFLLYFVYGPRFFITTYDDCYFIIVMRGRKSKIYYEKFACEEKTIIMIVAIAILNYLEKKVAFGPSPRSDSRKNGWLEHIPPFFAKNELLARANKNASLIKAERQEKLHIVNFKLMFW